MAFLSGQSWCVLKPWYTGGAQKKDFATVLQTDLTRSVVFICEAHYDEQHLIKTNL